MHNEQIHEAWWSYLKDMLDPMATAFPLELPYLFKEPYCGTCSHWFLINEKGLRHIPSPKEYDEIIRDLSGKRFEVYKEMGEAIDAYQDHRFYGWCRRFPPVQQTGYSILGFRSLFTFLNRKIPQKIAEYDFPLMPNDCSCGEWKEDNWVADFVGKYRK